MVGFNVILRHILFTVLLTGVLTGCAVPPDTTFYRVIESGTRGVILGTVQYAGTPPPRELLPITKDLHVCGPGPRESETLLVSAAGGLRNVVVTLPDLQAGKAPDEGPATLVQEDCRFTPHVLALMQGTRLNVLNRDPVAHTMHTESLEGANPPINRVQPHFTPEMHERFAYPGMIRVRCDIHSWMSALLVVTANPYFAVTDSTGAFALTDVPAGRRRVRFVHETLGVLEREIVVEAGAVVTVDLAFGAVDEAVR